MKVLRLLLVAAMIAVGSSASAQFANSRSSSTGSSFGSGEGPQVGYKGFVDAGYALGTGVSGADRAVFSTTHGYQVIPYFFAGLGAGFNYYTNGLPAGIDDMLEAFGSYYSGYSPKTGKFTIPIFADFRGTLDSKISPFVDFKIGYAIGDWGGFYISPSIGCRFGIGEKSAFNVGIGYESQGGSGAFSLRVGFDF